VYAGFAVGSLCGVAWFIATSIGRHYGLVDYLLDHGLIRWLRMRDLVVNEDLVDAGWERWETKRLRMRELAAHATASKNR
jgi:dolichyldiphosphatase